LRFGADADACVSTPAFIDTAYAADMLHLTPDAILDLVKQGNLRPYGGRAPNYFFRTADVAALVPRMAVSTEQEAPKRVKSASARVQVRLTADARWSDISAGDIRDWAGRADGARREAARKTATAARERLAMVLQALDEVESREP